jgi:hypothetical protein
MTAVKQLRQTTFLGCRDDETAKEVALERLMRNSLAHDFDRLIGSATLIGYKINEMLWVCVDYDIAERALAIN